MLAGIPMNSRVPSHGWRAAATSRNIPPPSSRSNAWTDASTQDTLNHIAEIKQINRELNVEHREWMICIGRGFDWLHMPNLALIIGPYSPDLDDPIRKAASIIEANMRAGRIPDDGFLLLAMAPYREIGVDRARAELKSGFLSGFAADVIGSEFPKLAEKMHVRTAVLNWQSRTMQMIDCPATHTS